MAGAAAVALVALTGCTGSNTLSPEQATRDCMAQAAQDAADATGQPVETFTEAPEILPTCEMYVHIYVTAPIELDAEPTPSEINRAIKCIGSVAEAAYKKTGHGWGSRYSDDMTYPETFAIASVESGC
jgi:hypothetical protein